MFTLSAVKCKGGDMSEYVFRTYPLIAQGRKFYLRSPSCGLSHNLHLCTETRAVICLESSCLISRRSRFRTTRSPSGALPGPTTNT